MSKSLQELALEYEVDDFYGYIIDSFYNGQNKQGLNLFKMLLPVDKYIFIKLVITRDLDIIDKLLKHLCEYEN